MLEVKPIRTKIYNSGEDFKAFLFDSLKGNVQDGDIVAVTSKIVSLAEGRLVATESIDKEQLIKKEADIYLGPAAYGHHLTVKENLIIPSAGIDESNSLSGDYILYPKDPFASAQQIWGWIGEMFSLKNRGVILTDSRTFPLRRGVIGAALSYWGFSAVGNKVGEPDLFGKPLKVTTINVADSLAVAATLTMGEGGECQPLALLKASVDFHEGSDKKDWLIPLEEDLYQCLLKPIL